MLQTLKQTAALMFGITVLTLGAGMLYVLIVVRAKEAGFSSEWIGVIQSAYQVGWLIAALIIPALIRSVGHIRVFAAVSALGSGVILLHILHIQELAWALERVLMGVCAAGLMIVSESWLNDMSDNKGRGKILAIYTITSWGAPAVGIWLLGFGDINSNFFFIVSSILISVGVLPILLSASRAPSLISVEHFNIYKLYQITPLGVFGTLLSGMCHGAFFGAVAIYATSIDMSLREVTNVNALAIIVGVLVQWPLGMLADRFDRRTVLMICAGLTALPACYFGYIGLQSATITYLSIAWLSAFCLGFYSQCITHANDNLNPSQIVSATGSLVLVYGLGYALTPIITGFAIARSPALFYWVIGLCASALTLLVLVRMSLSDSIENQGDMINIGAASPYSSVIVAAEEWSDEVTLVDNSAEMSQQPDETST